MNNLFTQKITCLLLLIFFPFLAKSQYKKETILTTGSTGQEEVSFLTLGNFHSTEKPNLIGKGVYSDNIYQLSKTEGGAYGNAQLIFEKGTYWTFIKKGDLSGDSKLDLVVYKDNGQVLWLKNDGNGGFAPPVSIFSDSIAKFLDPTDLVVTDINNDNMDDIVVRLPTEIRWYQSQGSSFSGAKTLLPFDDNKTGIFEKGQMAISDKNPEGNRKLALLANDTLFIADNSAGSFSWNQTIVVDSLQAGHINWYDMDQNGYQDLVATDLYSWTGAYHLWYFAQSQTVLNTNPVSIGQNFFSNRYMQYIWSVYPEDVDSDGDTDLFIQVKPEGCDPSSMKTMIGWLENQNGWTGSKFHEIRTGEAIVFTDLDSDGDTDILLKNDIGKDAYWLSSNAGSFEEKLLLAPRGIQGNTKNARFADIDQDGRVDIIFTAGVDIVWKKGLPNNAFAEPQVIKTLSGTPGNFMEARNMNSDKQLELVLPYKGLNGFNYVAYVSQDTLVQFISTDAALAEYPVLTGDADGDGDMDILTAISDAEYAWFENRDGAFSRYWQLSILSTGTKLTEVADIDGDGDLDVLTDRIWFSNNGDGTFNKIKNGGGEYAIDVDGDGDRDLIRNIYSSIQWHEQTTPSNFKSLASLLNKSEAYILKDLDGDNLPEIITYGSRLVSYKNSNGSFSDETLIDGAAVNFIDFADADNDTDIDIIAATDNEILLFRNPLFEEQLPPSAIILSDTTIKENLAVGTLVGELSSGSDEGTIYQLVEGEGAENNASFRIQGNQLLSAIKMDYETRHTYQIRIRATSSDNLSIQKAFTIRVVDVYENHAPKLVYALEDQSTMVEAAYLFVIPDDVFEDEDEGNELTYQVSLEGGKALPAWLKFDKAARKLSGTPTSPATLSLVVTVADQDGASASDTFQLVIKDKGNSSPVLANPITDQIIWADKAYNWIIPENTFTDPDNDALTVSAQLSSGEPLPSWLSFDAKTTTFSGTPTERDTLTILVKAQDTDGEKASDSFKLIVLKTDENNGEENHAPEVGTPIASQTILVGTNFEVVISEGAFSDADDDVLTYIVSLANSNSLPSWLTYDAATGTLSGTGPQADSISIKVVAYDQTGAMASQTFSIIIEDRVMGIDDSPSAKTLVLYPNPVKRQEYLYLESDQLTEKNTYVIWSLEGKIIQQGTLGYAKSGAAFVKLEDLKKGIYMIEIKNDSCVNRKRIIVE